MDNQTIMMLVSFCAGIAALVVPVIKLTSSIAVLSANIKELRIILEKLEARVGKHGNELDALKGRVIAVEKTIDHVEKEIQQLNEERG